MGSGPLAFLLPVNLLRQRIVSGFPFPTPTQANQAFCPARTDPLSNRLAGPPDIAAGDARETSIPTWASWSPMTSSAYAAIGTFSERPLLMSKTVVRLAANSSTVRSQLRGKSRLASSRLGAHGHH